MSNEERPRRNWRREQFKFSNRYKPKTEETPIEDKDEVAKPQRTEFEIIRREEMDKSIAIVKFKKVHPEAELPIRGTFGSAGYDIVADLNEDVTIQPGEVAKIPTGFMTSFRNDYVALVYSRSGLATKNGLVVAQGTAVIDSDYRGEWFIPLKNTSNEPQLVRSGDRIAQLLVQPVCRIKAIEVDDLNPTRRGDGGFGSTGR